MRLCTHLLPIALALLLLMSAYLMFPANSAEGKEPATEESPPVEGTILEPEPEIAAPDAGGEDSMQEPVQTDAQAPEDRSKSDPLSADQRAWLAKHDWTDWTSEKRAIWVSVDEQMCRIVEENRIIWEAPCSTAEKGTGSEMNSNKTPLGWHSVARKVGADAPWGQVFRARRPTEEVWQPGDSTKEDLVLTRILILDGEEPGKNTGGNVDSRARYIYVHGTNDETRIGEPASHGCIRLRNDAVIEAFKLVDEGAPLLITEGLHGAESGQPTETDEPKEDVQR